jgi:hypothetical protein
MANITFSSMIGTGRASSTTPASAHAHPMTLPGKVAGYMSPYLFNRREKNNACHDYK